MKFMVTFSMVLDDHGEGIELSEVDGSAQEALANSLAPLLESYGKEFFDSVIEIYGPTITLKRETSED